MISVEDTQRFLLFCLEAVGGGLIAILWLNFKEMQKRVAEGAVDFYQYKLHVAESYVTQGDLTKAIDAIGRSVDAVFKKLDRIEEKLDKKQDKE